MASDFLLPQQYRNIPLEALRISARRRLSLYLNPERLPNETGLVPDFNGLAEQIGFEFLEIQNFGRLAVRDPTTEVLNEWTRRADMQPTVGRLFECLLTLGREDVLTDCRPIIISDIEHYLSRREQIQNSIVPLQDATISQSSEDPYTDHAVDEYRCMTVTDVESGQETMYDAFICYNPDGYDLQFVKRMVEELESPRFGMNLFVPWRDDLPGCSTHSISARLIQYRCRRMVIIMSPRFLDSPSCDFQTKFAHSLSPGSRSMKLVPVLITPCQIPQILRHVTLCDFTKRDLMEWFWIRLARAIQAPLNMRELHISTRVSMDEITLNVNSESCSSENPNSGSSSSSEQLPIIRSQSFPQQSPAALIVRDSPMERSGTLGQSVVPHNQSGESVAGRSRMESGLSQSPGISGAGWNPGNPVPPARRTRTSDKNIPQLFPSSQC